MIRRAAALGLPGRDRNLRLLRLLPMSDWDKDIEILALRHQLLALHHQVGRRRSTRHETGVATHINGELAVWNPGRLGGDRQATDPGATRAAAGRGTANAPDETLFAAIIHVLVSSCAWRALPPCFGVSKPTAQCRLPIWSAAGVWGRLHETVLHRLDGDRLPEVDEGGVRDQSGKRWSN